MSRSGYCDDIDQWDLIKWRGQVASVLRGKRGQKLLVDLYKALDAMPVKELIADELETAEGAVCALGALGKARGLEMKGVDVEDYELVAKMFEVPNQLTQEIVYLNDEGWYDETPAQRYERMKKWVLGQIRPVPVENEATL
jgi:hypothetical protein